MAKVKEISETRKNLIANSVIARAMKKEKEILAANERELEFWQSRTINEIIKEDIYNLTDVELKTFKQWKKEGATIKKGSKAFALWGQPLQATAKSKESQPEETEESKYEYWPICLLFSREQVVTQTDKTNVKEEPETNKEREVLTIDEDM